MKLAASLRIGVVLSNGLEPATTLATVLEQLCLPSVGHWVKSLREATQYLKQRPDSAELPLGSVHDELTGTRHLPMVRDFADRISRTGSEGQPLVSQDLARAATQQGVLGFFELIAAYRNEVIGHAAQRPTAFYEEMGPLLLNATCEVLRQSCLFDGLTLVVARLGPNSSGRSIEVHWQELKGLGSMLLSREAFGQKLQTDGEESVNVGELYFVARDVQIPMSPFVVFREDRFEREQIGFLNRVVRRRRDGSGETVQEIRRCDYLDYTTGDRLAEVDTRAALSELLSQLRGRPVDDSEVKLLMRASEMDPDEELVAPPLRPGIVFENFELKEKIGQGGMAVVYRALQTTLQRVVALKILPADMAADPVSLARFRREIVALGRSDHPNLVKVLTASNENDWPYYSMELVEGTDLSTLLEVLRKWRTQTGRPLSDGHLVPAVSAATSLSQSRQAQRLSAEDPTPFITGTPATSPDVNPSTTTSPESGLDEVIPNAPQVESAPDLYRRLADLFADAADAMAHLHERGIIHRDIKPGNLMITNDGRRMVLMDLGLAHLRDRSRSLTPQGGRWLGTLRYCAPEQLHRHILEIDERADIYGLGATLFEMVALTPMFDGDSEVQLLNQVLHSRPPSVRKIDKSVPPDLAVIISKCTEKDPAQRYRSAETLAEDLRRFRDGKPVKARPAGPVRLTWRWCRQNPLRTLIGLAAILGLISLIIMLIMHNNELRKKEHTEIQHQLGDSTILISADCQTTAVHSTPGQTRQEHRSRVCRTGCKLGVVNRALGKVASS